MSHEFENGCFPLGNLTEAVKARYPEPAPKPAAYQGWRRDRKRDGAWQKVPGTEKPTKGECYQALMNLSELVGGEQVDYEYAILPPGEKPAFASGRRNLS